MSVETVLDTTAIGCLLPTPGSRPETELDEHLRGKRLTIALDVDRGLADEWERTWGRELTAALLSHWEGLAAVFYVTPAPRFPAHVARKLRQLGCRGGTIDRLILRTAIVLAAGVVVSEDKDFWNPKDRRQCGRLSAPVAKLLRDELNINVVLFRGLLRKLSEAA